MGTYCIAAVAQDSPYWYKVIKVCIRIYKKNCHLWRTITTVISISQTDDILRYFKPLYHLRVCIGAYKSLGLSEWWRGVCVECVCDIKALYSHHNGVFDGGRREGFVWWHHTVLWMPGIAAIPLCMPSTRQRGLSGIPLHSVCPRTPLTHTLHVCVWKWGPEFTEHCR